MHLSIKKNNFKNLLLALFIFLLLLLSYGCSARIVVLENHDMSKEENIDEIMKEPEKARIRMIAAADFGKEIVFDKELSVIKKISALDALKQAADVKTAYNGGFVNDINSISSQYTKSETKKMDWFYYINGISSNTGAGDYLLKEGDIERWDYHDWSYQMFIPAIIGDYPEPFLHGVKGNVFPTIIAYCDGEFKDEAERIRDTLSGFDVTDVAARSCSSLAESEKKESNIIIISPPENDMTADIMRKYKKHGFFAYIENKEAIILNKKGKIEEKTDGALMLASQNPWNQKGIGAFENVVWIITGTNKGDIEYASSVLADYPEQVSGYFGVYVKNKEIFHLPR
ncbi:MAG: DUF4430 domain-containing protein [Nanoarchaeota archaeon]|nr:DUF4430 domain-containing protein [Nanoarchaeota archaeon]